MKVDKDLVSIAGSLVGRDLSVPEAERLTVGANFHELDSLVAGKDTAVPSEKAVSNLRPLNHDDDYHIWTNW